MILLINARLYFYLVKLVFLPTTDIKYYYFLSKTTILKTRLQNGQYCTLPSQSDANISYVSDKAH